MADLERPSARRLALAVPAALVVLGLAHLHPLGLDPATHHPGPSPDIQELIWRLLWGVHALVTPGVSLMDANTFYPEDGTYATMDYAVGLSVLALPIRAFADNPLLVYNLTCFVSLALSAAGVYWLALRLTGSRGGALLAAALFAFNPIRLGRMGQVNILGVHWLPFLLIAADRLFAERGRRATLAVAAMLFLAITTGGYQAVFAAGVLAWATLVLAGSAPRSAARPLAATALAIAIAGAGFAPIGKPYVDAAASYDRVRTLSDVERGSPPPKDLLFLNSLAHEKLRSVLDPGGAIAEDARAILMPGALAWGLAAIGAVCFARRRGQRHLALLYGGMAVAGFAFSLGVHLPGYEALFRWLPPLQMVRAPSRFALVGLLGLAVLAAAAVAWLESRLRPGWARGLVALLLVAHLAETYRPLGIDGYHYDPPPAVYEWLAEQPGDFGIVELPSDWDLNTFYLVYSTYHWKRLVNGYNGSFLSDFHNDLLFNVLPNFPHPDVLARLEQILGLRYVVLHPDPGEEKMRRRGRWHARQRLVEALEHLPSRLEVVWRDEGHVVLELVPPPEGWSGRRVVRVAGTSALEGRILRFEARALPTPVPHLDHHVVVRIDEREVGRHALGPEPTEIAIALPAELRRVPGPHQIELTSVATLDAEALAPHLDLRVGRTSTVLDQWIRVRSAGPRSGNKVSIRVNGIEQAPGRRGYNLVTLAPGSAHVETRARFDTWDSRAEADRLAGFLEALPDGTIVVLASRDQASRNFTDRAAAALRSIGSRVDPRQGPVDSHVLIGVKGAARGEALEHWSLAGKVEIQHGDGRMLPEMQVRDIRLAEP